MKKLFTLLTMLILGIGSMWAGYIPTKRVTTFESGKMYMLYNTCVTSQDSRAGFIYWDGSMKKNTSFNPHQFATNNTAYLWKVTTGENNHIALQNVSTSKYIGFRLGANNSDPNNLYLYPWGTNPSKQSDAKSQNEADPSTSTENANITFETNKVFIIGNPSSGETNNMWNGNPGDIVLWSNGHPFAFYEVEEVEGVFAEGSAYKWNQYSFSTPSEVPQGAESATGVNQGYLRFDATGSVTCTFLYSNGNHRLDIYGVDVLDADGNVIANDYHHGYTGGSKENNVYTLNIPNGKAGTHLVRYFVGKPSNTTNGTITWSCTTAFGAKISSGKTATIEDNVHLLYSSVRNFTGSGNIVLNKDETISNNVITTGTGKLIISEDKTLTIGSSDTQTNSIASFSSIDLAGQIKNTNSTLTLNNVTVPPGKTGKIFAYDMGDDADGFKLAGTTTLNGNLIVCSKWNLQMKVDELAGSGTWLLCGTTGSNFDDTGTSSDQAATINVANASTYTGNVTVNNSNATVNVSGNLVASSWTKTNGTLKYKGNNLNGTTLDRVILAGSERLNLSNTVTIKNLAGNDLSASTNNYAIATSNAACLVLEGTCDFKHKANNTETSFNNISIGNTDGSITIKSGANVSCGKIWWSDDKSNAPITVESGATLESSGAINASTITNNGTVTATGRLYANTITNNGTITALKLQGNAVLGDGTTTLSDSEGITKTITVNGNATLNLTATTSTLSQAITVDDSKTLTIDGKNNTVVLTGAVTNNGTINFKNAILTANLNDRTLANYTFTDCTATLQFVETGDEYKNGGFTITNIPSGVTVKVKMYDGTEYETVTPEAGTATISHSVGVSGSAAWLDYTFNESTKSTNIHSPADQVITNAGNAGSGNNLTIDTDYNTNNSYNEDGTLKVMSTPWRNITWPTNYTVAVAGNVPDVENGCLVAFGSTTAGSSNYLAIVRGANQNEIKLVKGHGMNRAFEVISTMTAANATALSHLVVFTKNGNTFTVYLDGIQKTQVTYSDALGGGFQIGSIHGGVTGTGVGRVNDMATDIKNKIFAKAVRVYDYVISDDQMSQLTTEFPYTSFGGKYTRTITENSNLSATDAWLNTVTQGNVDIPVNAIVESVTYYPDVEITTDAASTLTVNADMDAENIKFDGTGKLTIASDGEHNIHIYGSVTANGPVSVKYGETDLSAVPVSIGESGSIEFDFSGYDFSSVDTPTDYPVTGNTADYGSKVTGVYPSDIYHTFTITHNSTTNSYYLTVGPSVALKRQQAIDLVQPYYDGNHVGSGLGKYTISLGETSYSNMVDFGNAVMAWESLEDCVDPTIVMNMPTTGYYRLKSQYNENTGYYLSCENNNDGKAIQTTTNDAKNIFYIEVGNSNSSIKSYSTGFYFGNETYSNYTSATNDPIKWTFSEGQSIGTYKLTSTYSGSKILYGWSTDDKSYVDRNGTADTDGHTDWILIPVAQEDLPVIPAPGVSDVTKPVLLGNITSASDVTSNITASAKFVDLSQATIGTSIDDIKTGVESINPNALIVAPEGTSVGESTSNVLVVTGTDDTYTCNNLQLSDEVIAQFTTDQTNFTDTKVTYTRASSASVWGTICLPYATSTEGDISYYRLVESSTSNLRFEKISDANTTANEPYLIKKEADAGLSVSAEGQDFSIGIEVPQGGSIHNDYKLQGVLVNTSVINGTNYTSAKDGYDVAITDPNAYYFDATNNTFRKLNGRFNLKAFRAYLTATSANARENIGIDIFDNDQPTGISFVESEDGKTVDVIFDLNGRRLQNAKKGINIINGKKVIK